MIRLLPLHHPYVLAMLAQSQIAEQPQRTEVDDLDDAEHGDAHEQADQASAAGQKIRRTVQLRATRRNELLVLEEDFQKRSKAVRMM